MREVLVDSDVWVDHLRGAVQLRPDADEVLSYSIITRCELFAGRHTSEKHVRALLDPYAEHPVDRATAERAGRLRRESSLRTPDALIAATALEGNLVLWTRNLRHFVGLEGLELREG